ncbi:MAG TPA: hypothetical protein VIE63_07990 [Ramlibacter sp.]|jgi:hypothetical protein
MKTQAVQPLVSTAARIATALAVVAFVGCAWAAAGHESEKAVLTSAAAMAPGPLYVTLPSVEIVGHRDAAPAETAVAANGDPRAAGAL